MRPKTYFIDQCVCGTKSKQGFSLVETLVVVLIMVVLVTGVFSISQVGQNNWQANKVKARLQQELRKAMEAMIHELRQAGDITGVPADGQWYTSVSFVLPSGVINGILSWGEDTVEYTLGEDTVTDLERIEGNDTDGYETRVIAKDVYSVEFRRQTEDVMEVALEARMDTFEREGVYDKWTVIKTLKFKVQLRN